MFIIPTFAQNSLEISNPNTTRLTKILNNAVEISNDREGWISVRIYKIDNGSGSAGNATCEVSHNLLIAVSEYDEQPNQNLFEIGPFYNPEITKITAQERIKLFTVEYGDFDSRQTVQMKVSIDELVFEK